MAMLTSRHALGGQAATPLTLAAMASIGAGAVHAAAAAAHGEHQAAVWVFTALAAAQIGWGAWALLRPERRTALVGAALGVSALVGWATAKAAGLPLIEGLTEPEAVRTADLAAAGLAAVALLAALVAIRRTGEAGSGPVAAVPVGVVAIAVALIALPGIATAASHSHDNAATHGHDEAAAGPAVVPPTPYHPDRPIDLGGVDGVTPEQQAKAENLIAVTLLRLPRFADPAVAEATGFRTIGDGVTGYEHFVNWSWIDDGRILDPDYPESLVYRVDPSTGERTLEAAMYMLPRGTTLDSVPSDVGGRLVQWHIHDDLCFTSNADAPRVAGLTAADGTCRPPLQKLEPVPMVHVWIVAHECGPFAALEGVGAGQIKAGESRLCDHVHGSRAQPST